MSRNYEIGTRDMKSAGKILLAKAKGRKECSFSSAATLSSRWSVFCDFAKLNAVGRMERVNEDFVSRYADHLKELVLDEELSIATAQNYLSAINTVMGMATHWTPVTAVRDCAMLRRSFVRTKAPVSRNQIQTAIKVLSDAGLIRQSIISRLCLEFGLRSKEASLLNTNVSLRQSFDSESISIIKGTKGGRLRHIPITSYRQMELLKEAADFQGKDTNLTPSDQSFSVWRNGGLRTGRDILISHGATGFHELRAIYACDRYKSITGHDAACIQGVRLTTKEEDHLARQLISRELGHSRIEITTAYLGSMK